MPLCMLQTEAQDADPTTSPLAPTLVQWSREREDPRRAGANPRKAWPAGRNGIIFVAPKIQNSDLAWNRGCRLRTMQSLDKGIKGYWIKGYWRVS